jgi:hypothetical protein
MSSLVPRTGLLVCGVLLFVSSRAFGGQAAPACLAAPYTPRMNAKGGVDLSHASQGSADPGLCRQACCDSPSCTTWILLGQNSSSVHAPCVKGKACCYLKQAAGKLSPDANAVATGTFVQPAPEPPQPHITAGYETSNVFWPYDSDTNGTVYACTYLPTLVLANRTRLIAHGSCGVKDESCGGFHHGPPHGAFGRSQRPPLGGNPITEGMICQKHSDDGGRTWSRIRVVAHGVMTGQVLWDGVRKVLIMHSGAAGPGHVGPGKKILTERRSHNLGETWSVPRNMSFLLDDGPKGDTAIGHAPSFWASAGAGLQLSPSNRFHPNRLVFCGHMNGCMVYWYSDDGESDTRGEIACSRRPLFRISQHRHLQGTTLLSRATPPAPAPHTAALAAAKPRSLRLPKVVF